MVQVHVYQWLCLLSTVTGWCYLFTTVLVHELANIINQSTTQCSGHTHCPRTPQGLEKNQVPSRWALVMPGERAELYDTIWSWSHGIFYVRISHGYWFHIQPWNSKMKVEKNHWYSWFPNTRWHQYGLPCSRMTIKKFFDHRCRSLGILDLLGAQLVSIAWMGKSKLLILADDVNLDALTWYWGSCFIVTQLPGLLQEMRCNPGTRSIPNGW